MVFEGAKIDRAFHGALSGYLQFVHRSYHCESVPQTIRLGFSHDSWLVIDLNGHAGGRKIMKAGLFAIPISFGARDLSDTSLSPGRWWSRQILA